MTPCSRDFLISIFSTLYPGSFSPLLLAARAPDFFFNVQVLFLPSHTLINEFFLFPSFPAHRTFPAVSTSRLPRFPRKSSPPSPLLSPRSFSQAIANSHDNPPFSRRVPTSRILPILFEAASSFRSAGDLFPLMSKRPHPPSASRAPLTHSPLHHGRSAPARVCASKVPDKPANLFAGNCPQILLAGKIKFRRGCGLARSFGGTFVPADRRRILFGLHFCQLPRSELGQSCFQVYLDAPAQSL